MLDAFHPIASREKVHATIGEQRKDLDVWTKGKQSRVGGDPPSETTCAGGRNRA